MNKSGKLFSKPFGPSSRIWANMLTSTTREVICEACGTVHKERKTDDDTRVLSRVFGLQIVEECCGGIIDVVYKELRNEFFTARLEEFAENPIDLSFIGSEINRALDEANIKAQEVVEETLKIRANIV